MPKRRPSSQAWLKEHFTDPYVQRAKAEGFRSRSPELYLLASGFRIV